jgi:undecaprenyl phosphate-alpha-L-ara4FN deformylase
VASASSDVVGALGLRIDVDTLRGARSGVPRVLEILARHGVHASCFFSVGPDNMGRNLWRLANPAFLAKMRRTGAATLYGWDILLRGTFWPGPEIGRRTAHLIRAAAAAGHEIGLHAWDHYGWQRRVGEWSIAEQREQLRLGLTCLEDIVGRPVDCCAVAGWRCNGRTIEAERDFGFRYSSDCRGDAIFRPRLADGTLAAPQIPVTLPTYDEVVNRDTDAAGYNDFILSRIRGGRLNVHTVHAEVEGIALADSFDRLLKRCAQRGVRCVPLGLLLPADPSTIPVDAVATAALPGREGWVGWQAGALASARQ